MNYCPNCGAPVVFGQNFCGACGADVREKTGSLQALEQQGLKVRGLGRNTMVYLTNEGLRGERICSPASLYLAVLAPLFLVSAVYHAFQAGPLVVYATLWVAASALMYDELRWRGVHRARGGPSATGEGRGSWTLPWRSIQMVDWNGRTLWFTGANQKRMLSVTFDRNDAAHVEMALESANVRYSRRLARLPPALTKFSTLVLLVFIIGQAVLILAATLPFFPGEEQMYTTILNNTRSQITGATFAGEFQSVFLNNIQIALAGAIPFLGTITYAAASYNTGRVLQAIAIGAQLPPSLVLVSLYLFPHTWVEEMSYPIATAAGLLAFTKWRSVSPTEFARRRAWGSSKFALALVGAAFSLAVAGFLEALVTYIGYYVIALWAPLIILSYLVVRGLRKRVSPSMGSP